MSRAAWLIRDCRDAADVAADATELLIGLFLGVVVGQTLVEMWSKRRG
jgi:hypothetical protein